MNILIIKKSSNPSIIVSSTQEDIPVELYALIRWIIVGTEDKLETEVRTQAVDRDVLTLCQNVMFRYKSKRQVTYQPKSEQSGFRLYRNRENPQTVGMALTLHHQTRSKMIVNLLNTQGYCVSYSRTLMMETALANAVIKNTEQFQGLYVPPFLKKGTFVFFAVDNVDFTEDTADGKGTTHGTITAVYQKADSFGQSVAPPLCITDAESFTVMPYHTPIIPCEKPKMKDLAAIERTINFSVNKII